MFHPTDLSGHRLANIIESEVKILRYWICSTIRNYKYYLRHTHLADKSGQDIIGQYKTIQDLINRALSEYRRKQTLLRGLRAEMPSGNADDILYYLCANHWGESFALEMTQQP